MALGGCVRLRVDVNGVVWTGLHASLAADTDTGVEFDDAIRSLEHGGHRANVHAGRVGAMVAARHLEETPRIRKRAFFDVLYPGAVDSQGYFVFGFARRGAGMAADALAIID
jgi:hypothetical protein